MSLARRFDPRRNSFDALRLVLAGLVAVDHGIIMRTGVVHQINGSALGDFAVDGFFVLSGFLVCRSYLRMHSLSRYLWHRAVRILPGFWVCLVVTALIAAPLIAVLEHRAVGSVFVTDPTAFGYITNNFLLSMQQFDIAGLLAATPSPSTMDGALWTLVYEAFGYLLLGVMGVVGILAERRWVVVAATAVVWLVNVLQSVGVVQGGTISARLMLLFLLGCLAHLFADKLPMSGFWAIAATVVFVASILWVEPYRVVGAPALAYLLIWMGSCSPITVSIRTDLSYGLYIYHYLTFQVLMLTPVATLPVAAFVLVGFTVSLVPAAGSWFAIEKPALARKNGTFIGHVEKRLGRLREHVLQAVGPHRR
jgi:peptidoglycan/LPS O-acetylase OafA/YrhL